MLTFSVRNLSPDASSNESEPATCEKCEQLAGQSAYLGNWIKETENPKLKKQLEKTLESVKGTIVLHKFEQHSSSHVPHPVRSSLSRPQNWSRPRIQGVGQDKLAELPKRPK